MKRPKKKISKISKLSKTDKKSLDRALDARLARVKEKEIESLRKKTRIQGDWLAELFKIRALIGPTPEMDNLLVLERDRLTELIEDLLEIAITGTSTPAAIEITGTQLNS
jgi:hypothetical protein